MKFIELSLDEQLKLAGKVAKEAHIGQLDKGGNPYINHPLFVAESVENIEYKIAALLHDVLEDSSFTSDDLLRLGFSERIVNSVVILTKSKNDNYEKYLAKIQRDDIARHVKIADLKHNSDISRIDNPTKKDIDRMKKYKKALDFLQNN